MWKKQQSGSIIAIYITESAGAPMQSLESCEAIVGYGLKGDRYCNGNGYWKGADQCQITLIQAEHLDQIKQISDMQIEQGQHRRNLVTQGVELNQLGGRRFKVGEAELEFDGPRPPCSYIQEITQAGMIKALYGRSGICAKVLQGGIINIGDNITTA